MDSHIVIFFGEKSETLTHSDLKANMEGDIMPGNWKDKTAIPQMYKEKMDGERLLYVAIFI